MEEKLTKAVARHLPITGRQAVLALLLPMLAVTGLVSWQVGAARAIRGGSWAAAFAMGALVGVMTAALAWPLAVRVLRTAFPRAGLGGEPKRQILVHGSSLSWWWWAGFLPVGLLSLFAGPWFLVYLGVFAFKTAKRFVLVELRADGASVRGALDPWEEVSMVRVGDRSLELVTAEWKYALAFDHPTSEEIVLWLQRLVDTRLSMRSGGVTAGDMASTTPAPPPTLERPSDVRPLSPTRAAASLLLALGAASLLAVAIFELMGSRLHSNPGMSVPIGAVIGVALSLGLGLWKHCARLIGGSRAPANPPFAMRNLSLLHNAAPSGIGWVVAVGLSLLGVIVTVRDGNGSVGLWLSYAAAPYAMLQLLAVLVRARVVRLAPDCVRVGRVFGRSEVVTDVASYGDSLTLKTERRSWPLRFRPDRVGLFADGLASTIRSRIDAGKGRAAAPFRAPPVDDHLGPLDQLAHDEAAEVEARDVQKRAASARGGTS